MWILNFPFMRNPVRKEFPSTEHSLQLLILSWGNKNSFFLSLFLFMPFPLFLHFCKHYSASRGFPHFENSTRGGGEGGGGGHLDSRPFQLGMMSQPNSFFLSFPTTGSYGEDCAHAQVRKKNKVGKAPLFTNDRGLEIRQCVVEATS